MNKLSIVRDGAAAGSAAVAVPHRGWCRHPRVIWVVGEIEGASQKPFDGDPYTRLARTTCGRARYMAHGCVGFKARRLLTGGKNRLPHRASAGRANCYSDSIRSSRLFLGRRNRRFQVCVACQPQRPQSGGLFVRGRTRCLVFGHCLLPLSKLLFLFLESRFGAVTRPFSVGVQSRYSFSSQSARRTDFPA
jgi:hypothetical protein